LLKRPIISRRQLSITRLQAEESMQYLRDLRGLAAHNRVPVHYPQTIRRASLRSKPAVGTRTSFLSLCLVLSGLITLSCSIGAEQQHKPMSAETHNPAGKLIVIGFLGGKVSATNLVHREAQLINSLQQTHPHSIHAASFANRDGDRALKTILELLDEDKDGRLNEHEKSAARIVIFGHSWGASETVTLADRLNKLDIPVLLTIQVDSVRKRSQNDERIPPNVREAANFYQSEGLLRGRSMIVADDPSKTTILGNHESSYRQNPVSCAGFPWYARAFMKRHIEIENDPAVWDKIEALILTKVL
jgi:hypothetical protein